MSENNGVIEELEMTECEAPAEKKTIEVEVPDLVDMETRIMRRFKSYILSSINEKLFDSSICQILDAPIISEEVGREDIYLTNFAFWRLNQSDFLADIDVRVSLKVAGDDSDYDSTFTLYVTLWFCIDDDEFDCELYELGNGADRPERKYWKLDRFLIPIHGNDNIEEAAEKTWEDENPESMKKASLRKPNALAEHYKLTIRSMQLVDCDDQPYILFFDEGYVMVQGESEHKSKELPPPKPQHIDAKTIVLNTNAKLLDHGNLEIYKACFQYEWHYIFYRLNDLCSTDTTKIPKVKRKIEDGKDIKNPLNIMRIMTDKAAMGLMLPYSIMKDRVFREYRKASVARSVMGYANHSGWRYDRVIRTIADDFDVAKFRVRQRIVKMGMVEAKGAINYDGDNKVYFPAFGFDPEAIGKSEEFYITRRQLFNLYQRDEAFRGFMHRGEYAYLDGLVCLNTSDNIEWKKDRFYLTYAANRAVHHCCLRIVKSYDPKTHKCRCAFDLENHNKKYAPEIDKFSDTTVEEREKLKEKTRKNVPEDFGAALQYFMRNRPLGKISREKAATACRMKPKEFDRYCDDPTMVYTLKELIDICVGLHLAPWESDILFEKANIPLPRTGPLAHFGFIVDCLYLEPHKNIDGFVENLGVKSQENGGEEDE